MHPWVKSDKPGQCTVCGMDLVPIYEGGKNFDHAASNIVMLPEGSPNVIGVQTAEVKKQPLVRTSVLWPGKTPCVYVEKQPGVYGQRSVKLRRKGDDDWEVLDGLKEGELVVTSGNMLIDGQAQLNSNANP